MRGTPDVVVQEFDPLHNLPEPQGDDVEQGRRTILFHFTENVEGSIADQIQTKIVEHVKARFMLKLSSLVELRNIEDNTLMEFYQRPEDSGGISPWFETLTASENWVRRQEEARLLNMRRPDTKWVYERTKIVYAKVILDRHPLFLGRGYLPDWLRNKRGVLSLDTYNDNRCLFRCIAVHQGAHVKRNVRKTMELERSFFTHRPGLRGRLTFRHLPLLEQHFKQGIAAYTVQPNGDFILTHLPANYDRVGRPVLTMGLYAGHAFLIQDLAQVARSYTCGGCQARFTKSSDLLRHTTSRCTGGQTKVVCPNNRIQFPPSAYEKAFYPETRCSFIAIKWLEWEAKQRGIHIHHARCGHGGERKILGARVDGYHPETKTIFQYHGCFWHGCKQCYPERSATVAYLDKRDEWVVRFDTQGEPMTRQSAYDLTLIRAKALRESGYRVVEKWEHETPTPWANLPCLEKQTATYPHAIVYDFEAYQDVSKVAKPTCNLTYESEHVPISVSLADTLNTEPEYIVSKDPNELIRLFHESLERRYEAILADVVARFRFSGTEGITDAQSKEILQWVTQVPVVGFNSGHYDLKLIRKYYVPLMAKDKEVFAAEKNGRIMFINTPKFKFLDVLNYLAPGITYDKWVKDKDKALLAEVFKLLGNSAYGKFIEAVERQNKNLYTRDEEEVDKHLRSAWFQDLEEIGDAYKIELRKDKLTIKNPFQVGIVVYQLAKLRMLQFYYEFLDFYFDRQVFEHIQMDTDSMYFAFSREKLEDAVRPGYEA